ncbi:hypothetical protein DSECCO2_536840 [anaerobic digester metagenome]
MHLYFFRKSFFFFKTGSLIFLRFTDSLLQNLNFLQAFPVFGNPEVKFSFTCSCKFFLFIKLFENSISFFYFLPEPVNSCNRLGAFDSLDFGFHSQKAVFCIPLKPSYSSLCIPCPFAVLLEFSKLQQVVNHSLPVPWLCIDKDVNLPLPDICAVPVCLFIHVQEGTDFFIGTGCLVNDIFSVSKQHTS